MENQNDEFLANLVEKKPEQLASTKIDLNFNKAKKPKKESFSVYLDHEVNAALDKLAFKNRVSKSVVIESILRQVLPK